MPVTWKASAKAVLDPDLYRGSTAVSSNNRVRDVACARGSKNCNDLSNLCRVGGTLQRRGGSEWRKTEL